MSKKLTCPASAPALSVALSQQKESLYAGTSPRANRAVQASDKTATPKSGALSACRRRHCTHQRSCMRTPKSGETDDDINLHQRGRALKVRESQSKPSSIPSPVVAQVPWMNTSRP
mmetsp:Transcript_114121/g.369115  ORF Transcript_114121/g.369115 Transcript_114121/m.369115 type:complete len:116 (-) Transcript_114121:478-825(-)